MAPRNRRQFTRAGATLASVGIGSSGVRYCLHSVAMTFGRAVAAP